MKICIVDDCNSKHKSRGYCGKHYNRLLKNGSVHLPEKIPVGECLADGCEKKKKSRGYCSSHYNRLRRYGDPLGGYSYQGQDRRCEVNGCERKYVGLGFCQKHLALFHRNGHPEKYQVPQNICIVKSCDEIKYNLGFCRTHYRNNVIKPCYKPRGLVCYVNDGECDSDSKLIHNLCKTHYGRIRGIGKFDSGCIDGKPMKFIESLINIKTDSCINWPFYKGCGDNRAVINFKGEATAAARVALIINGFPPPSSDSYALHDPYVCSNPSCVNLRHLRWGTCSDNMYDRAIERERKK